MACMGDLNIYCDPEFLKHLPCPTSPSMNISVLMNGETPGDSEKEEVSSRKAESVEMRKSSIFEAPSIDHFREVLGTKDRQFFHDQFREVRLSKVTRAP